MVMLLLKPGVPDIQGIVNYPDGVKGLAADGQTAIPGMPKFADTTRSEEHTSELQSPS